jgi:hypothetical protein
LSIPYNRVLQNVEKTPAILNLLLVVEVAITALSLTRSYSHDYASQSQSAGSANLSNLSGETKKMARPVDSDPFPRSPWVEESVKKLDPTIILAVWSVSQVLLEMLLYFS